MLELSDLFPCHRFIASVGIAATSGLYFAGILHGCGPKHVPAKWNPVRRRGHAATVESTAFPGQMGSPVIPSDQETL